MKYLLDTHCHTVASGHAYSTLTEYINQAHEINLKLMAITDHGPKMPGSCGEFYFGNLRSLPKKFDDLEVLYGSELNIIDYDGNLDLPIEKIKTLDIKIASLHTPCITPLEDNTDLIIKVMNNPDINIFGHLGDPRFLFDIPKVINHAKKTNTVIEINNSSLNPNNTRYGGKDLIKQIIFECKKNNLAIILNSDAHFHLDLANFNNIYELIHDFPEELILNTSVERFKDALNKKNNI